MHRITEGEGVVILRLSKEEYALLYSALRDKENDLLHEDRGEETQEERNLRVKDYLLSDDMCKEFERICRQKDWDELIPTTNKEEKES